MFRNIIMSVVRSSVRGGTVISSVIRSLTRSVIRHVIRSVIKSVNFDQECDLICTPAICILSDVEIKKCKPLIKLLLCYQANIFQGGKSGSYNSFDGKEIISKDFEFFVCNTGYTVDVRHLRFDTLSKLLLASD